MTVEEKRSGAAGDFGEETGKGGLEKEVKGEESQAEGKHGRVEKGGVDDEDDEGDNSKESEHDEDLSMKKKNDGCNDT